jgi:hypothetical protein
MNIHPEDRNEPGDPKTIREDTHVAERTGDVSPRFRARVVGVVYLLFFLAAILGEVFMQQAGLSAFSLSDDAAATANNILTHQLAYQLGFALTLISNALYVTVTALFYRLFQPVSKNLSLLALCFSLMGQAISASGSILQLAPLVILNGSPYLNEFNAKQLQALALLFLHVSAQAGSIALLFDGLFLLLLGYLIFRSTFLPRILGALVALAGLGWLIFLALPLVTFLPTFIQVLGILAEVSLMLWLLVMGINSERWKKQASAAGV